MNLSGPINPKVIDISHYDDVVGDGFQEVRRSGIVGVIQKSSEGSHSVDDRYRSRVAGILAAGLCPGAYHFIRPGNMKAQADFFLRAAGADPKTFLVSLDHEVKEVSKDAAREFIEEVERLWGRKVVLYSGNVIKEQLDGLPKDPWWGARRLWLAMYAAKLRWRWPSSWLEPWLVQYTGDGAGPSPHNVNGIHITGGLDISHYEYGDDQLRLEWVSDAEADPQPVQQVHRPDPKVVNPQVGFSQRGVASWYDEPQEVKAGGRLDPRALTAAHQTLPMGSKVKVTSDITGKSVVVTINDRGPYVRGRIIDLTPAAFMEIGSLKSGVAVVHIEVVE